jgi:hypothetical protein
MGQVLLEEKKLKKKERKRKRWSGIESNLMKNLKKNRTWIEIKDMENSYFLI